MPKRSPGLLTEDHVNRRFGERMRACRDEAGRSQSEVGDALGVSFQQIQKYENGTTSISLNRIVDFADYIEISLMSLFDGLDTRLMAGAGFTEEKQSALTGDDDAGPGEPLTKQQKDLLRAFRSIRSQKQRRSLIDLARSMSEPDHANDD